ncbi:hypothetical protein [Tsukamurella sp. PLM1]|uniref:hypothetical protein n=1 Tax=Tsukamurella sp. PLM1 TaxID=2929795 RepID=UPI00205617ED|nr:hypothetical protein [Tsukamurella sp. PLM1]BDH57954.1 hypothetical protein MTP03_28930 [Tsukamurella sp. PLM1]
MTTTLSPAPSVIEVTPPLYPCGCGDPDCALTVDEAAGWFPGDDPVPHVTVLKYVAEELGLLATCRFFDLHVERSIARFTEVAEAYAPRIAAASIVESVNTWHGCPEALCGGNA